MTDPVGEHATAARAARETLVTAPVLAAFDVAPAVVLESFA
jgi:hypothetical protein